MKITFELSPAGALSRNYSIALDDNENPASPETVRHIAMLLQEASRRSDAELESR